MARRIELLEERPFFVFELHVGWEHELRCGREESGDVLGRGAGDGAHGEQAVGSAGGRTCDRSRDAEDIAILFEGEVGGDQRTGLLRSLNDHGRSTQAGDETVAQREVVFESFRPWSEFANERSASVEDPLGERQIRARID